MATPWEYSFCLPRAITPINASLLVRTLSPRHGERLSSERLTSRQWNSSSSVPIVLPETTTLRVRTARLGLNSHAVELR